MSRYDEFRRELSKDGTTLLEDEAHAENLRKELGARRSGQRRDYILEELRATDDHIRDIKAQMTNEEDESC